MQIRTKAEKHIKNSFLYALKYIKYILHLYNTKNHILAYSTTNSARRPMTSLHQKERFRVPNKHQNHEA
jgi:hypothetical protein